MIDVFNRLNFVKITCSVPTTTWVNTYVTVILFWWNNDVSWVDIWKNTHRMLLVDTKTIKLLFSSSIKW